MTKRYLTLALAVAVLCVVSSHAVADMSEIAMVKLKADTQVKASPEQVWKQMTTGKSLVTWCPYWKSEKNSSVMISKVGDVLDFQDDWGNGGRSIITFVEKNKEIRIAHEPMDGSYVCHSTLMLEPAGEGTHVTYIEQYTDESGMDDKKATSAKMQAAMKEALAALKANAEKKS
jgi:uncharacterized protein YndB with AHSA1/START domain